MKMGCNAVQKTVTQNKYVHGQGLCEGSWKQGGGHLSISASQSLGEGYLSLNVHPFCECGVKSPGTCF